MSKDFDYADMTDSEVLEWLEARTYLEVHIRKTKIEIYGGGYAASGRTIRAAVYAAKRISMKDGP